MRPRSRGFCCSRLGNSGVSEICSEDSVSLVPTTREHRNSPIVPDLFPRREQSEQDRAPKNPAEVTLKISPALCAPDPETERRAWAMTDKLVANTAGEKLNSVSIERGS